MSETVVCRRCGLNSQRIHGTEFSAAGKRDYYRKVGPLRAQDTPNGRVYQHQTCPPPLDTTKGEYQR